jgi:hypothetical protein
MTIRTDKWAKHCVYYGRSRCGRWSLGELSSVLKKEAASSCELLDYTIWGSRSCSFEDFSLLGYNTALLPTSFMLVYCLDFSSTMKMEAIFFRKVSWLLTDYTASYPPKNCTVHTYNTLFLIPEKSNIYFNNIIPSKYISPHVVSFL